MAAGRGGPFANSPRGTVGPRLPGQTRDSAVRCPPRRSDGADNRLDTNGREMMQQEERRNRRIRPPWPRCPG
jgi:hypothetical protein